MFTAFNMNTLSNLAVKSDVGCSSTSSSSSSYSGQSSPASNNNNNMANETLTIATDFIIDPTSLAAINYGVNDLSTS